jgi:hypothetical protein
MTFEVRRRLASMVLTPATATTSTGRGRLAAWARSGCGTPPGKVTLDRVDVLVGRAPPTNLAASATRAFACAERRLSDSVPNTEACMLLSLRRRGQLLLLTCALLGAVAGTSLGMMAEYARTPSALAVPPQERGAAGVAASPPSGSEATAPRYRADSGSVGKRTAMADRAGHHHKAGNGKHDRGNGKHDRGRPADRGTGKPDRK